MADTRELILARLAVVCAAVEGVAAVERNRLDASGMARPSVIIHDGGETAVDQAGGETAAPRAMKFSALQWMTLSPEIELHLWLEDPDSGPKLSLYRNRIVFAVLNDTTLRSLVGSNGNIGFKSFGVNRPRPEERERRADLGIDFTYLLRLSDLGS